MSDSNRSILPQAVQIVVPLQYVFAVYLMLRGHNLPGGGFIGGLVLASALVLRVMVRKEADRAPRDPLALTGIGLGLSLLAGIMPLFVGKPFFTGLWGGSIWLPLVETVKLGTPLLFDTGVFLVVTGVGAKVLYVLLAQRRMVPPTSNKS